MRLQHAGGEVVLHLGGHEVALRREVRHLCRTERMFNATDRLPIVIDMILANNEEDRKAALDRLLPIQRGDFVQLFTEMAPHPVTVRLLDPQPGER